jgi:hypothetical protein
MDNELQTNTTIEESPVLTPPNPPNPSTPPIDDTPLGEKGEKALEAWKQRAKESEAKQREYETRLRAYQEVDLEKYQELVKQAEQAEILQAEKEKNWEKLSGKLKETNATLEQQVAQKDMAIADFEKRLKIQAAYYRNRGKDMDSDNPLFRGQTGFDFIYERLSRFVELSKTGEVTIINDQGVQWIDSESNQPLTMDQLIAIAESQFPQFFEPAPKPNGTGTMIGRDGQVLAGRLSHEEYMEQRRQRKLGNV